MNLSFKKTAMIKGVKEIVEKLLSNSPHLRDDDLKLLANVYWQRISNGLFHKLTEDQIKGIKLFLGEISKGNMPNYQSVSRCRRKLQQENPELRGKLYDKRHEMEQSVKHELKFWD